MKLGSGSRLKESNVRAVVASALNGFYPAEAEARGAEQENAVLLCWSTENKFADIVARTAVTR